MILESYYGQPDWRHIQYPFRLWNRRRNEWTYQSAESALLIVKAEARR